MKGVVLGGCCCISTSVVLKFICWLAYVLGYISLASKRQPPVATVASASIWWMGRLVRIGS